MIAVKKCIFCGFENKDDSTVCEKCRADISHDVPSNGSEKESVRTKNRKTRS